VGFAAAHRLREQKGTGLVATIFKAGEGLLKQRLHPAGEKVLFKELFTLDLAFQEVGQVEDDIAAVAIEDALAWRAVGLESHGRRIAFLLFPVSSAILR
jgi:hypothetical protein